MSEHMVMSGERREFPLVKGQVSRLSLLPICTFTFTSGDTLLRIPPGGILSLYGGISVLYVSKKLSIVMISL